MAAETGPALGRPAANGPAIACFAVHCNCAVHKAVPHDEITHPLSKSSRPDGKMHGARLAHLCRKRLSHNLVVLRPLPLDAEDENRAGLHQLLQSSVPVVDWVVLLLGRSGGPHERCPLLERGLVIGRQGLRRLHRSREDLLPDINNALLYSPIAQG